MGTKRVISDLHQIDDAQKQAILNFILDSRLDDFDQKTITQARYCLMDLLAVAATGSRTKTAGIIKKFVAGQMPAPATSGAAPVLFSSVRASPAGAALAGATIIDSIDAHDGFKPAKGHIGCGVLPACLAVMMAEHGEIEFGELLCCLIIGYEIGGRAALALHGTVSDYHTSGAWVAVAVAGISARIMGLDREAVWHAMGIAEYHGPRSQMMRVIDYASMLKDGSGWGAFAGVSAAYLARDGFTGAPAITISSPALAPVWQDLGTRFIILEQYFKPWPVCRWAQPAMQGILDIVERSGKHSIRPDSIASIKIDIFHEALRLASPHPASPDEAQYSLCWPVAALIYAVAENRQFGPYDVSEQALLRDDIHLLADKITLSESDVFNAVFPELRQAEISITLVTGEVFSALALHTRGDPEAPLGHAELEEKFTSFMAYADYADIAPQLKHLCLHAGLSETGKFGLLFGESV
jgi:2-methylcitrate dehydratase PrpD